MLIANTEVARGEAWWTADQKTLKVISLPVRSLECRLSLFIYIYIYICVCVSRHISVILVCQTLC